MHVKKLFKKTTRSHIDQEIKITTIRYERADITTDSTDIKIIREYYE